MPHAEQDEVGRGAGSDAAAPVQPRGDSGRPVADEIMQMRDEDIIGFTGLSEAK